MSGCDCQFDARNEAHRKVLLTVFAINSVMFVAEIIKEARSAGPGGA